MSKLKDYKAVNEPVLSYFKNSVERKNIEEEYEKIFNESIEKMIQNIPETVTREETE